jgi:hypothetical protein
MGGFMSSKLKAGTATSGAVIDADTTGILELQSGSTPTTAVTIDTSQNVGIGTSSSPSARLTVIAEANANFLAGCANSGDTYAQLSFFNNAGTNNNGQIGVEKVGTNGGLMYFRSKPDGGSLTERMRIDSSGRILFGTTDTNVTNGAVVMQDLNAVNSYIKVGHKTGSVNGSDFIAFYYNNTQIGGCSQNGTTAVAYNTSSDYRLKENIAPMIGALAAVQLLKPVTYKWKSDGSNGQGFIAHELAEVVPDCVTGEKDAVDEEGNPKYQGIDTSFLVATLTSAIQELNAKVDAQALEIQALKGVA